jgi:hypothetical protein
MAMLFPPAREEPHRNKHLPLGHALVEIELQQPRSHFTDGAEWFDDESSYREVFGPTISPRVKKIRPVLGSSDPMSLPFQALQRKQA